MKPSPTPLASTPALKALQAAQDAKTALVLSVEATAGAVLHECVRLNAVRRNVQARLSLVSSDAPTVKTQAIRAVG